jgi:hypothetical protein
MILAQKRGKVTDSGTGRREPGMVREGPIMSETQNQTEDYVVLYRRAFQDFGAMAF